ncbi:MAG: acyltransferase [Hyphomicrobiales bacterium]|nr:acyltransferase [Hyphomicrobiales bacterium]MDE2115436.1 acyltransferase [Hyphomicrobiales bacterium]
MEQLGIIQILRAVAALMVVVSHAQDDAQFQAMQRGMDFHRVFPVRWDAGVDLFFVISGFIMVHASHKLFATPRAGWTFLRRRCLRIVPLYWFFTALQLAALAYQVAGGRGTFPHLDEILSSFGFFPFARPEDGAPRPISALGWTLNYEMFFYLVFSMFLFLPCLRAVAGVVMALSVVAMLAAWLPTRATALVFWGDMIIFEFAFGMALAVIWRAGWRMPRFVSFGLVIVSLGALVLDGWFSPVLAPSAVEVNGWQRLLSAGVPMALLLGGLILTVPALTLRGPIAAFAKRLGDASYALYLVHPFVITLTRKAYGLVALKALGLAAFGLWPMVICELVLAIPAALLVHEWLEVPVTHWLQGRLQARALLPQGKAATP